MGTIKKGILGGFSGKVGTVVGASWRGISYMRSLPQKVRNPRTAGQRSQRSKFTLALALLKPMTALLRIGWKLYAHRQSPFNAAMSYTLANAITGTYPNYQIDAGKVLISRGALTPAKVTAERESGAANQSFITFKWADNSGTGSAKATDLALITAIARGSSEMVITQIAQTPRTIEECSISIPEQWQGNEYDVYFGWVSEDGKEVSNSVYLGLITA